MYLGTSGAGRVLPELPDSSKSVLSLQLPPPPPSLPYKLKQQTTALQYTLAPLELAGSCKNCQTAACALPQQSVRLCRRASRFCVVENLRSYSSFSRERLCVFHVLYWVQQHRSMSSSSMPQNSSSV